MANRLEGTKKTGAVVALTIKDGLSVAWQKSLDNNPNSTSIDAPWPLPGSAAIPASRYVTVADGYPVGDPAKFYLFDASGRRSGKPWKEHELADDRQRRWVSNRRRKRQRRRVFVQARRRAGERFGERVVSRGCIRRKRIRFGPTRDRAGRARGARRPSGTPAQRSEDLPLPPTIE